MSRLPPVAIDDVPELKPLLEAGADMMGFMPNDALVMARRPDMLQAFAGLIAAIYGPGEVDSGLKRLIGEATSKAAGCFYCSAHAAHGAEKQGVPQGKIEAVWSFEDSPLFTDAERAAIRVAMNAGVTPNAVTDEDFSELRRHFSDAAVLEIVSVIAMFGFLNRWNNTLMTDLEARPAAFAKGLEGRSS